MKKLKVVFSVERPKATDVLWLKPVGNKFIANIFNNGSWKEFGIEASDGSTIDFDEMGEYFTTLEESIEDVAETAGSAIQGIYVYSNDNEEVELEKDENGKVELPSGIIPVFTIAPPAMGVETGQLCFCTCAAIQEGASLGTILVFDGTSWKTVVGTTPVYTDANPNDDPTIK